MQLLFDSASYNRSAAYKYLYKEQYKYIFHIKPYITLINSCLNYDYLNGIQFWRIQTDIVLVSSCRSLPLLKAELRLWSDRWVNGFWYAPNNLMFRDGDGSWGEACSYAMPSSSLHNSQVLIDPCRACGFDVDAASNV